MELNKAPYRLEGESYEDYKARRKAIKEATKQLNTKSEPFAAKRMDRSIQKALTGKSINKLEF